MGSGAGSYRFDGERLVGRRRLDSPHSVLSVYPNSGALAMANLGFLKIMRLAEAVEGWHAERAFAGMQRSWERKRTFSSFDLIAFSLSYELDYLAVPRILAEGRIPPAAADRDDRHPPVVAGGAAVTINPRALAGIVDLAVSGEGEGVLERLLKRLEELRGRSRREKLAALSELPGVVSPSSGPGSWTPPADPWEAGADYRIVAGGSVFPGRGLIEVGRGCARGCRFCSAGYIYRPARYRSPESVLAEARRYGEATRALGLVSPSVSDHPRIGPIARALRDEGFSLSVSSLRAETAAPDLLEILAESGQKEIALAPEAGSPRLRRAINKPIPDEIFLEAARSASRAGMQYLKIYFMVGLPGETAEDLDEALALARRLREIIPLRATTAPFVPRPGTPFQYAAMETPAALKRKTAHLAAGFRRIKGVEVRGFSVRQSIAQCALGFGGPETLDLLRRGRLPEAARISGVHDPAARAYPAGRLSSRWLRDEWEKAGKGESTPPCAFGTCRACGAC